MILKFLIFSVINIYLYCRAVYLRKQLRKLSKDSALIYQMRLLDKPPRLQTIKIKCWDTSIMSQQAFSWEFTIKLAMFQIKESLWVPGSKQSQWSVSFFHEQHSQCVLGFWPTMLYNTALKNKGWVIIWEISNHFSYLQQTHSVLDAMSKLAQLKRTFKYFNPLYKKIILRM